MCIQILLAFLCGCLVAALVASVFLRRKAAEESAMREKSAAMQAKIEHCDADIRLLNGRIDEEKKAAAQRESALKAEHGAAVERLKADRDAAEARLKTEHESAVERLKAEHRAALDKVMENAAKDKEKALGDKEKADAKAMSDLQLRFDETLAKVTAQLGNVTEEMLKKRQEEFSKSSAQSIDNIVNPLKTNLSDLKKAMEEVNKEQAVRNGELGERISSLMKQSEAVGKSAEQLAAAFRHGSKIQGDWGETILTELLQKQGLTRGVHFDVQPTMRDASGAVLKSEDGNMLRPDLIVHLDTRRELIIDSKVSLTAFTEYVNADTEEKRTKALDEHIASLKKHRDELAKKDYSSYIRPPKVSAGYVIMFVPHAGALWTALNAEPTLWRDAADRGVYIADEQTLYAALKMVNLTWTQVAQARNHERVFELASEMIERVGIFMEKYAALGKALDKAKVEYDEGRKKLDPSGQSIVTTSNKLLRLGAKNSCKHPVEMIDIDEIPSIEENLSPEEKPNDGPDVMLAENE